jgi:2-polyprenyl-3-methyl-5-hydroxy-6-metoxy-1,4-benzoquinol methylase
MKEKEWEKIYKEKASVPMPEPAGLLREYEHLLTGGRALDIAAGEGHNGIFLAGKGYAVTSVDRASSAVDIMRAHAARQGVSIEAVAADMLAYPIAENSFDVMLNFYFLERDLVPKIKAGLRKDGLLFFETYTLEQQQFGGPHNPDFLLKPNELLLAFLDFFIIFYHERIDTSGPEPRAIASLVAQKV